MKKACLENNLSKVKFLIYVGADPNGINDYNSSPSFQPFEFSSHIAISAEKHDAKILNFLLLKGANPNFTEGDETTPIAVAVSANNLKGTKSLLQAGANPWHTTKWSVIDQANSLGFRNLATQIQPLVQ